MRRISEKLVPGLDNAVVEEALRRHDWTLKSSRIGQQLDLDREIGQGNANWHLESRRGWGTYEAGKTARFVHGLAYRNWAQNQHYYQNVTQVVPPNERPDRVHKNLQVERWGEARM